ncbi:N-acetyltransferase [Streptomyces hygroscopicus]|nr:N-acetyltransferase [Streptomyces hygroscopicus]
MAVEMSDVPEAKRYEARGRRCGSSLRRADLPRLRKQREPGRL